MWRTPAGLARGSDQAEAATSAAGSGAIHAWTGRPGALFSVRSSHHYLAGAFKDPPGNAHRGEVQRVLQILRWDPIEGQVVALGTGAAGGPNEIAPSDGRNRGREAASVQRRLGLGPEVSRWLARNGRDLNLGAGAGGSSPGLWVLELCSCFAGGPDPDDATRAGLDALKAYKAAGGQGVYVTTELFYWRRTYHLVLPGPICVSEKSASEGNWHAEGGQYDDDSPISGQGPWRRRARAPRAFAPRGPAVCEAPGATENARPADSFDPRPAYIFDGLAEDGAGYDLQLGGGPPGQGPRLRFRPFVLRFGRLVPWPPNWLEAEQTSESGLGTGRTGEMARLAAWYGFFGGALTMTWRVSPPLEA